MREKLRSYLTDQKKMNMKSNLFKPLNGSEKPKRKKTFSKD